MKDEHILGFIRAMYCFVVGDMTDDVLDVLEENQAAALKFAAARSMGVPQFRALFSQALKDGNPHKCKAKVELCLGAWKKRAKALKVDVSLTKAEIGVLNDLRSWLGKGSEPAFARLEANARLTQEPRIYENMVPERSCHRELLKRLRALVREHAPGSPNPMRFTRDALVALRKEAPNAYKEHQAVKAALKKAYLRELRALVRDSGQALLDVAAVDAHMRSKVLPHNIPKWFRGQLDENGKFYTVPGKKHPGRLLRTTPSGKGSMNPQYDPDKDDIYVISYLPMPDSLREQQLYTVDYYKKGQMTKFRKVEKAIPLVPKARTKWRTALLGTGEHARVAMLCEVAYLTSARIGSKDGNLSKGKRIYGLSTLRCKHVKVSRNKLVFQYHAKSAMEQHHEISATDECSTAIIEYVKERKKSAGPDDFLFTHNGARIQPQRVNEYLRTLGLPITVHKLRTVHGTTLFRDLAEKSAVLAKAKLDVKALNSEIDKLLEQVGEKLGHFTRTEDGQKVTGNTALAYYINPPSVAAYYDRFKVHYPAKLQKAIDNVVAGK